jgi:hypothetical protein
MHRTGIRRAFVCRSYVVIDRLPGLLGDLKSHRLFFWRTGRALDRISVWSNVLDLEGDNIAAAQLAVDGEVEQRQVALAVCDLKYGTNRPDVFWRSGGLAPINLPLFQAARMGAVNVSLFCIVILLIGENDQHRLRSSAPTGPK